MSNFFESGFIKKLQEGGDKLSKNPFVAALQGTMMSLMAPIMVGAVFAIICAVCSGILHLFTSDSNIYKLLYIPYHMTMDIISLWVVYLLGKNYAEVKQLSNPTMTGINSVIVFLCCVSNFDNGLDTTYLGATGMFIGFLLAYATVTIEKFCVEKNIRIKMPEVCPEALVGSFNAILPLVLTIVICYGVNILIILLSKNTLSLPSIILFILSKPLNMLISVPGMFVLGIISTSMWVCGVNGSMIVYSVIMSPMIMAYTNCINLYNQGVPLTFDNAFSPIFLFGATAMVGGTGNTWPLCIMGLRSKSEQLKGIGKAGLVPGWFGVNEPVTFGMPIMFNPIMAIPYILTAPLNMLLTYIGYRVGFLHFPFIMSMALLPIGFGQFVSTLSWQNFIWDYLMFIPDYLLYLPFFKAYEKQLVAKEQQKANS